MVRSREQMIADITSAVNAGQDLGQAISQNIIAPIQTKPEYQAKIAEEKAKGIKYETFGGKVYKNENGVLTDTGISAIEPEKSQFTTIGQDEYGNDIKGFVNPATQTVTPYGVATTTQAINSGEILPNTQEYNDLLAQNPTLVESAKKISQIKPTSNIEAQANTQINKIVETTGIGKYLEDGIITANELNELTNTTETQIKQNKLSQLTASREELQKKYDDIENQIDKEHP